MITDKMHKAEMPDGTWLEIPKVAVWLGESAVFVDHRILPVDTAVGVLILQREWWKNQVELARTTIADLQEKIQRLQGGEPKEDRGDVSGS